MVKAKDVKVGDSIPLLRKDVGKYQPILYAGASGDFNPIHIDPEWGKNVGLGGSILQGLCTMAFVSQMNVDWLKDPSRLKKLKVRFVSPVKPEDTITIEGKVIEKKGDAVKCEISVKNQEGTEVMINVVSEATL
ncbi:MaoC family dehydratase [Thermodesulfovibrionales bacterium]|nr:MaoC family dehydratase [Thermodesulfovibrionales bacterium]